MIEGRGYRDLGGLLKRHWDGAAMALKGAGRRAARDQGWLESNQMSRGTGPPSGRAKSSAGKACES